MTFLDFDWDIWNINKNELKHGVSKLEAESVFYDSKFVIFEDFKHSEKEKRFVSFGYSSENRILMVGFTIRKPQKIRIITARIASAKERKIYEQN